MAGLAMAETDMSGEEEKNSENGKDSAEMIQEMRYNEVVCYEKLIRLCILQLLSYLRFYRIR